MYLPVGEELVVLDVHIILSLPSRGSIVTGTPRGIRHRLRSHSIVTWVEARGNQPHRLASKCSPLRATVDWSRRIYPVTKLPDYHLVTEPRCSSRFWYSSHDPQLLPTISSPAVLVKELTSELSTLNIQSCSCVNFPDFIDSSLPLQSHASEPC
jgi:hypothetical protein